MTQHKVTNVAKINYMSMSEEELAEVYRLKDLRFENECTAFDADGDEYVCLRDLDGNTDDRGYAVYLKSTGDLRCLVADAPNALDGYEDCEYGDKRSELYRQIALLAGWPEHLDELNHQLTWRQLLDEISKMPKEFLDTTAYVYRPDGGGTLAAVRRVMPWLINLNGTIPGPHEEGDNRFFIDNAFDGEED